MKYIIKDKIGNESNSLLDDLLKRLIAENYITGYENLIGQYKDNSNNISSNNISSSLIPLCNIPLYKGIVEKDDEILIYEYVNTQKIENEIAIDNCKAIMSHEPLDCCLTFGGAAKSILKYSIENPEHCGYFIVSKVNKNISIDVLNDLKNRLKLYNDNKLNLKDQDKLSELIMKYSNIRHCKITLTKK